MNKLTKIAVCTGLALSSGFALSATKVADARGNGMGNTGVATASFLVAPFYNPALTAMYDQETVGVLIPAVEVAVQDKDKTIELAEDLQDLMDKYLDNLDVNNASVSDLNTLNGYLDDLDNNSPLTVTGGAGIAVAIPNDYIAANVFVGGHVEVIGETNIDDTDTYDANPVTYATNTENRINASTIELNAFGYYEVGVAFAKRMQLMQQEFSFGVSPKYQELKTYSQSEGVNDFDVDDYDESEKKKSAFNLDLGAVWYRDMWRAGLAVKNLFSQKIDSTANNKSYELKPQATVAGAYITEFFTAAIDVDLTKQTRFTNTNDDTQFVRFGVEGNAWNWAQLRVGYEIDTQDTLDDSITAGIGLSPFNVVHLDLAGSYAGDNQFGGSLNLAVMF